MLDNGIAEPCCSNWASPCLLVKKSDSTFRPCTDYRNVNNVTKADLFTLFLGWRTVLIKLGQQSMLANLIF